MMKDLKIIKGEMNQHFYIESDASRLLFVWWCGGVKEGSRELRWQFGDMEGTP